MRWKGAAVAFLLAQSAWAETITEGTQGFSVEIDTSAACVVVPSGRRTEVCKALEPIPTTLPEMGGKDARYVFLASMPLPATGRYWLGIIRLAPPGGVDREGLTRNTFSAMQSALRDLAANGGKLEVSQPNASEIATTNDIDRASVSYEAWTSVDPTKRYASDFLLYFGSEDYVFQTFSEAVDESAVQYRMQHQLATLRVPPRVQAPDPSIDRTLARIRDALILVALLVVVSLVARDVVKLRAAKPKRDPRAANLNLYERARRVGILAAIILLASVALQWTAYVVDSASVAKLLQQGAWLVSLAVVAPLLIWVYRVVSNARAVGCVGVTTASMAVTWFFVPAASAYFPFKSLSEVAAASRRRSERTGSIWLVAAWWLTWIASMAARFMEEPGLASLLRFGAAIAACGMVVELDQNQEYLRRKLELRQRGRAPSPS